MRGYDVKENGEEIRITDQARYAAFISYAHTDEGMAQRLHRALETYAVPKGIETKTHEKLSPIFRDVTELTAHHSLSEKIRDAVRSSRYLIVLCSPAAKTSHWVNEEIRLFRKLHGDASILCVIVDGAPDTAFPPALVEGGREPLAANISGGREGFRFGVTQLAASMLGVGLDQLVQRDAKRRRTRMGMLTAAALVFAGVMGGMAWTAIDAQGEAETSRSEAEKLVEYMIKDLKAQLDPVGKLDILDGVGDRVVDYYAAIPLADMDDDRLARQARARHILGEVAIDQGKKEKAKTELEAAYAATKEVLRRNPNDTDAIFAHAQSEYWLGEMYSRRRQYKKALPYLQEYDRQGQYLLNTQPENVDWIMEAGWGSNNLGAALYKLEKYKEAQEKYSSAVMFFEKAKKLKPNSTSISIEYANALAGLSNAHLALNEYIAAHKPRLEQVDVLTFLTINNPDNIGLKFRLIQAQLKLIDLNDKQLQSCNITSRIEILGELHSLTKYDQSNFDWNYHYVKYWHGFLIKCRKGFDGQSFNARVEHLSAYIATNFQDGYFKKEMRELIQLKTNSLD